MYGKLRPYLRKAVAPSFEGISATDLLPLKPIGRSLNRYYLAWWLLSPQILEYAVMRQTGVKMPRLRSSDLRRMPVPLPPRAQQDRIVSKIEALFTQSRRGREALEAVPELLAQFRQAVLARAFRGELVEQDPEDEPASVLLERIRVERRRKWEEDLRSQGRDPSRRNYKEPEPPDTSELPELPEAWVWTNLRTITVIGPQNGLYLPRSAYGKGVPILRIDDYRDGRSRSSDELQLLDASEEQIAKFGLRVGDLVINRVNSPSHLGKCVVISERNVPSLFESNMMRLRLSELTIPKLAELYLRSSSGRARLTKDAKWAVNQASINQEDVGNTPIILPPRGEQGCIVTCVEALFSVADALQEAAAIARRRLEQVDQAILARAFRGELVEQDPEDEPAWELLERIRKERSGVER